MDHEIEVHLGQVNAGFGLVTDWVQITNNGRPDIYPYAWVEPVTAPDVHIDTFTAAPSVILEGASATLSWSTRNAQTVSISPGIGSVNASGSIEITPTTSTTYTLTALGQGGPKTAETAIAVVSFSLPLAVNCGASSPPAPDWMDEGVFRTGGVEHDFAGSVDLEQPAGPCPGGGVPELRARRPLL